MPRLLTHLLVAVFTLVSIAFACTFAWSNFIGSSVRPAYIIKVDFDQVFADATAGHGEISPTIHEKPEKTVRSTIGITTDVNRDRKSDRLPVWGNDLVAPDRTNNTTITQKNVTSPIPSNTPNGSAAQRALDIDHSVPTQKPIAHCERVASPFVDPGLARFIGHCFV
jgi:hypothetical protein